MRVLSKEFAKENPILRGIVAAVAVCLMLTVSLWGPALEWLLRRRDQYRSWRGAQG